MKRKKEKEIDDDEKEGKVMSTGLVLRALGKSRKRFEDQIQKMTPHQKILLYAIAHRAQRKKMMTSSSTTSIMSLFEVQKSYQEKLKELGLPLDHGKSIEMMMNNLKDFDSSGLISLIRNSFVMEVSVLMSYWELCQSLQSDPKLKEIIEQDDRNRVCIF